MSFSVPQAASVVMVPWLDAAAAFSSEDAAHLMGFYRYAIAGVALNFSIEQAASITGLPWAR